MSSDKITGDYDVGYGKPPQHSKWRKGTCGNPKGRPKGSKNLKTDLSEELKERLEVKEGSRTKTITKQRALIKSLFARAIKGSDAAAAKLIDLCIKADGIGDEAGDTEQGITAEERAILASFEARFLPKKGTAGEPAAEPDGGNKA